MKKYTLAIKDMKHIQYIDKNITKIFLFARTKLRDQKGKY